MEKLLFLSSSCVYPRLAPQRGGRLRIVAQVLERRSRDELEESAMLTLLCGIAHSRLGRLEVGQQWAMVAQLRARALKDRMMEVRALNVCGAIALERGGIDEATYFFSRAQEEATDDNDMATVGRCANNLGIIANMQGDFGRAVGAYTRAIAAYQKAGYERGIAESHHNLGISYREPGLKSSLHISIRKDGANVHLDREGFVTSTNGRIVPICKPSSSRRACEPRPSRKPRNW